MTQNKEALMPAEIYAAPTSIAQNIGNVRQAEYGVYSVNISKEQYSGGTKYIRADLASTPQPESVDVVQDWEYLLGEISAANMLWDLQSGVIQNLNDFIRRKACQLRASAAQKMAPRRTEHERGAGSAMLDPDMPAEEIRLHMGEMTPDEVLLARAAISWANSYRPRFETIEGLDEALAHYDGDHGLRYDDIPTVMEAARRYAAMMEGK